MGAKSVGRAVTRNALTMPRQEALETLSVIAGGLRLEDRNEALAATGGDPEATLVRGLELSSHAWFIYDRHGSPIAVFGAAPSALPGAGIVWMMGTPGIAEEGVFVARQTLRYLRELHETYHLLWNYIDARNEVSQEWLLRSGFHLIDLDPAYGVERRPFYEFARLG